MRAALGLARRGLGETWPNPAVGCVIARQDADRQVVGRGWTGRGGRPHAETEALRRAGAMALGATAYVTLEPCSHQGQTPPCCGALIEAGIDRAVIALADPNPRVSGRGISRLRDAGVAVTLDVGRHEAQDVNAGFLTRVEEGRPLVTLKTATTLDGRIATHSGESRWITGERSRAFAHGLRASHDAVMVGSGTALSDNPDLTCRLPGMEDRSPVRIVCDSRMRLDLAGHLVETAKRTPTWLITLEGGDKARRRAFRDCGVEVIEISSAGAGSIDLRRALEELAIRGLTRVLVEGGGHLAAALLRLDLVDRVAWFRAPRVIGGDGSPTVAPFGVDHLSETPRFVREAVSELGTDILETYRRED